MDLDVARLSRLHLIERDCWLLLLLVGLPLSVVAKPKPIVMTTVQISKSLAERDAYELSAGCPEPLPYRGQTCNETHSP